MYGAIHALIRNRKKTGGTPEGETEGNTRKRNRREHPEAKQEGTLESETGGNTRRQDRREHPKARQPTGKITRMWMAPYTHL